MSRVSFIVISDIHLGHNNTPTQHIVNNLKTYIFQYSHVDYIFIAGDMFDRLLDFSLPFVYDIISFAYELIRFCKKNDIKIRILEGTPSHDWQQSKMFDEINRSLKEPCDLIYISKLDVLEETDISVLYVPDEWASETKILESDVLDALKRKNRSKVDLAIMHGCFNYQDPSNYIKNKFREEFFMPIVEHYIFVGHFHTHTFYMNKIIAQGSFDRLAHGEEEPKGFIYSEIDLMNPELDTWQFIINKGSQIYKTIKVTQNETIESLTKKIVKYQKGSYIRLLINPQHPLNQIFDQLKLKFLDYFLTRKINDTLRHEDNRVTHIVQDTSREVISLTLQNLGSKLIDEINSKGYDFTDKQWQYLRSLIEERIERKKPCTLC